MKKSWKTRLVPLVLASVLLMSTILTGCSGKGNEGASGNNTKTPTTEGKKEDKKEDGKNTASIPEEKTIKIMLKGPRTEGFDQIYEEYLNRTKDTLNIKLDITFVEHADYKDKLNLEMSSGGDWDLVFDASWIHLRTLAADGYYADLEEYFNNDAYPGLKKAFSSNLMENNRWYGSMCYIPLLRTFGNGLPAVHYRADWSEQWGIGEIDSYEKLEAYWAKAKENSITPVAVTDTRGFFQILSIGGGAYPGTAEAGIQAFMAAGITYWVYIKDNQVAAIAAEGAGDEAFADFPEGWNYDFGADRYEKFVEWQSKGFISPDSMTLKDANTPFWSGIAASKIGTLDDVENDRQNIELYSPGAKIGEFIYVEEARKMEPNAIPSAFAGNNGLAVPANSKNIEATMRFLDWLFASEENHNLFELGIESVDYTAVGENQFEAITDYAANWAGYGFTWNPNYVRFSTKIPEDILKYRLYELQESTFAPLPVRGFSFNGTDVEISTIVAQVKAITDKISVTKLHGILNDGSNSYNTAEEMLKKNIEEAYAVGADKLEAEFVKQINEYMANK